MSGDRASLRQQGKEPLFKGRLPSPFKRKKKAVASKEAEASKRAEAYGNVVVASTNRTSAPGAADSGKRPEVTSIPCFGTPSGSIRGRDSGFTEEPSQISIEQDLETLLEEDREDGNEASLLSVPEPKDEEDLEKSIAENLVTDATPKSNTSVEAEVVVHLPPTPTGTREETASADGNRPSLRWYRQWLASGAHLAYTNKEVQTTESGESGRKSTRSIGTSTSWLDVLEESDWEKAIEHAETFIRKTAREKGGEPRKSRTLYATNRTTMENSQGSSTQVADQVKMKYKAPPTFYGKEGEDAIAWMERYEKIAKYNRWSTRDLKDNFEMFLDGAARKWYSYCESLDKIPRVWTVPR